MPIAEHAGTALFLKRWLRRPLAMGAVVPSGRLLAEALAQTTLAMIQAGTARKGDVLGIARIAAIQAAKRTADLIPLAHPLPLTHVSQATDEEHVIAPRWKLVPWDDIANLRNQWDGPLLLKGVSHVRTSSEHVM